MEREIKFRVIYKNKIDGYERLTEKDDNIFWEWMCPDLNPDNRERWNRGVFPNGFRYLRNQFTGLHDKNGKEIYEGDIVRILYTDWPSQTPDETGEYPLSLEDYKKSISTIGYVNWNEHSTGWIIRTKSKMSVNKDGTVMTSIIHGTHGEREIIGNVFENPDLLTNQETIK